MSAGSSSSRISPRATPLDRAHRATREDWSSFDDAPRLQQNVCAALAAALLCAIVMLGFAWSLATGAIRAMVVQPATRLLRFEIAPPPPPEPPRKTAERRKTVRKPIASPSSSVQPSRKPAEASPRPALSSAPMTIAPSVAQLPVTPLSPTGTVPIGDAASSVGGGGSGQGGAGSGHGGGGRARLSGASWIREPDSHAMTIAESPRARSDHITGVVKLACLIDEQGRARSCSLLDEAPEGYDFGRAAMSLSPSFRIRAVRVNGRFLYDLPILVTLTFKNG